MQLFILLLCLRDGVFQGLGGRGQLTFPHGRTLEGKEMKLKKG
jgi:hypothetical protein